MGILNLFRRPAAESKKEVQASVPGGAVFNGLDDPALLEIMRTGGGLSLIHI